MSTDPYSPPQSRTDPASGKEARLEEILRQVGQWEIDWVEPEVPGDESLVEALQVRGFQHLGTLESYQAGTPRKRSAAWLGPGGDTLVSLEGSDWQVLSLVGPRERPAWLTLHRPLDLSPDKGIASSFGPKTAMLPNHPPSGVSRQVQASLKEALDGLPAQQEALGGPRAIGTDREAWRQELLARVEREGDVLAALMQLHRKVAQLYGLGFVALALVAGTLVDLVLDPLSALLTGPTFWIPVVAVLVVGAPTLTRLMVEATQRRLERLPAVPCRSGRSADPGWPKLIRS